MLVQACLNGARTREDHPAVPITPEEIAADAAACVAAGAGSVHVHPRDGHGRETFAIGDCLRALREVDVEVSVSTGAWIAGDRLAAIAAWRELPDLASVNVSEEGWRDVCEALASRGVGIEIGLATEADAEAFLADPVAVARVLIEIPANTFRPEEAAVRIDALLGDHLAPRLWHGEEEGTWRVIAEARIRGRDVRIGLEDVLDADNPTLVRRVVDAAA